MNNKCDIIDYRALIPEGVKYYNKLRGTMTKMHQSLTNKTLPGGLNVTMPNLGPGDKYTGNIKLLKALTVAQAKTIVEGDLVVMLPVFTGSGKSTYKTPGIIYEVGGKFHLKNRTFTGFDTSIATKANKTYKKDNGLHFTSFALYHKLNRTLHPEPIILGQEHGVIPKSCAHVWKQYTGLTQAFEYCEVCDVKK